MNSECKTCIPKMNDYIAITTLRSSPWIHSNELKVLLLSCTSEQHLPHHNLPCDLPAAASIYRASQVSTGEVALFLRVPPQPTAWVLSYNDIWFHRFMEEKNKIFSVFFPFLLYFSLSPLVSVGSWRPFSLALCREPGSQRERGTERESVREREREFEQKGRL